MSGEWLGLSQSRVVWSKLGPINRCGSWHSVNTRIEDTQLLTEVDHCVQFWKTPQIPAVHRRVPPSKCLRNWLLPTGGPLFRSYPVCSFPTFLLLCLFYYRVSLWFTQLFPWSWRLTVPQTLFLTLGCRGVVPAADARVCHWLTVYMCITYYMVNAPKVKSVSQLTFIAVLNTWELWRQQPNQCVMSKSRLGSLDQQWAHSEPQALQQQGTWAGQGPGTSKQNIMESWCKGEIQDRGQHVAQASTGGGGPNTYALS